jgi:hypothetical protein
MKMNAANFSADCLLKRDKIAPWFAPGSGTKKNLPAETGRVFDNAV